MEIKTATPNVPLRKGKIHGFTKGACDKIWA